MPTATSTPDQSALANMLAQYSYYLNPQSFTGSNDPSTHYDAGSPAKGGSIPNLGTPLGLNDSKAGSAISGLLDPTNMFIPGLGLLNLFNQKKAQPPAFQPYVSDDGRYVWADPRAANPVPISNLPGAHLAPSDEYIKMADQLRGIMDFLPQYSAAISSQKIPDAMGQLAADTATTGPRLALQQQLQEQYGPIFDQLAAESNQRKSMSNAQNDLAVLQGPGKDLVAAAQEAAKQYDPEYFATRSATSDSLAKLLSSTTANLGKGMTGTERDEVGRGLALEGSRRGTVNAPSNLDTVGNAMAYGAAGRARENDSQNQLSKAISASTAFLPQSRSNVDVFQVATGRPSYNQNDSRFNTSSGTGTADSTANSLLNTGTSMWTTDQNNALTRDLNKTNWMDTLSAITGAIGSVGGMAGGMLCWVAREVYGVENPRWLAFRDYVIHDAPTWFRSLYIRYGERFAKFISDKPQLKKIIRNWMNRKIERYGYIRT